MLDLDSLSDFKHSHIFFWDFEEPPPQGDWNIVLWRSYLSDKHLGCISMPELVESHADSLKQRFLAWIYELGETNVGSANVVDHLALYPGFSFWWMTLLAEKSYSKSNRMADAIRLLLVEELIQLSQVKQVTFSSADRLLSKTVAELCHRSNISFHVSHHPRSHQPVSLVRWAYIHSPYFIQASVSLLKQLRQIWPFRAQAKSYLAQLNPAEVTFFDYFIHLDQTALQQGRFSSNFWSVLPTQLIRNNIASHWVHRYIPHNAVPTSADAVERMTQFSQQNSGLANHRAIDAVMDWKLLALVLKDYSRLVWRSMLLRSMKYRFTPSYSKLNLWLLFKNDWLISLRGSVAMMNCLSFHLIQKTLQQLPRQKLGLYLQENQGWEMALIAAWRAAGHGQLVGVVHSTVRYWDLRYFYDPRTYCRATKNALPMPDKVALNGAVAWDLYETAGYPIQKLIKVEALRYLYLLDISSRLAIGLEKFSVGSRPNLRILICGDIQASLNHQLLSWLQEISRSLSVPIHFMIKPHPACMINAADYPGLSMQISQAPLGELFTDCDGVITSNHTSAVVDAVMCGLPVIQILDGCQFNLSPLRGDDRVCFVKSSAELKQRLMTPFLGQHNPTAYFYLDANISRWRELFNSYITTAQRSDACLSP